MNLTTITMPVTKKDLEDMMTRQKEKRVAEMEMLKQIFMEGVKEHVKEQLAAVREEISEELTTVRNELNEKVEDLEKKQNEASDVQSVFDCRMDEKRHPNQKNWTRVYVASCRP